MGQRKPIFPVIRPAEGRRPDNEKKPIEKPIGFW
jgi:hypothetical protein